MAETVQKNFRMSSRAIKLLHEVARARGMTETDVVETCVAKYALEIGQDVDRAKELLFQQICSAAAKSPVFHSRAKESLALNEEATRETGAEGRKGLAAAAEAGLSAEKLHETASELHKAVEAAERVVEKAHKRGPSKRK